MQDTEFDTKTVQWIRDNIILDVRVDQGEITVKLQAWVNNERYRCNDLETLAETTCSLNFKIYGI